VHSRSRHSCTHSDIRPPPPTRLHYHRAYWGAKPGGTSRFPPTRSTHTGRQILAQSTARPVYARAPALTRVGLEIGGGRLGTTGHEPRPSAARGFSDPLEALNSVPTNFRRGCYHMYLARRLGLDRVHHIPQWYTAVREGARSCG